MATATSNRSRTSATRSTSNTGSSSSTTQTSQITLVIDGQTVISGTYPAALSQLLAKFWQSALAKMSNAVRQVGTTGGGQPRRH